MAGAVCRPDVGDEIADLLARLEATRIVSIVAAIQAATIMEERLKAMHSLDYQKRRQAGELDTEAKRKKLLCDFAEELERKKLEWANLQVSVFAGCML